MRSHLPGRWDVVGPFVQTTPAKLVIAPQDVRTADPTVATDIYAGLFAFAGHAVDVGGNSPFLITPPSEDWARSLHGFSWLRHLRASESTLSRSNARALVDEWIRLSPKLPPIAWEDAVASRRLLSWLSQSPLILEDCDHAFYQRFLKAVGRHVHHLRTALARSSDGISRIRMIMALTAAAAAIADQPGLARWATRALDREISLQILPDGGHISRNPGLILDLLVDLLPIRQALSVRGITPSPVLGEALDRMMPMLRFFRHGDGSFVLFNGMGSTHTDLVATVLAYDDSRGTAPDNARHSGYQRMAASGAVVLMDTGTPPPLAYSRDAHAGCLSFEFSDRTNRIIVNCGMPAGAKSKWRGLARSTAAHSTLIVEDTSSARILPAHGLGHRLGPVLYNGPKHVDVRREDDEEQMAVVARHDGYAGRFGLLHERTVVLSADGRILIGRDRLEPVRAGAGDKLPFAVRFHLHPQVRANRSQDGHSVLIVCEDRSAWRFTAEDIQPEIEESVFLAGAHGMRRTAQIVLYGRVSGTSTVTWQLEKEADRPRSRRRPAESGGEGREEPLLF
ncbi:heparinase II/III family protein [Amorphus orientalis]|uniref:Heparinase superfamily protein n=1 Tax=Amorphus orientalis TaxID=649198 RepID=A0AAE3VMZ8_9HYPH|nr:heparinase II/III family protein [Amorphus orientalis]MDQ0314646.1 putative heparinase superfamily protein [Amorphus orientalis]